MASALTIDISATRAITATGRLVAGEAASVGIVGATPKKLYLINAARDVIAYCDTFDGGNGTINLATEQIAAIIQDVPAGRAVSVACLIEDANDVIGCGFVPLISAPMPEQLEPINIDPYLRESQVGAGLAIVDGKLVCTVNPSTYLSKAEAAQTYATQTALAGKQNTITDLAAIRAGAAKGATAYQVPPDGIPAADMKADVVASLMKADTAVQSVNGVTPTAGALTITGADIETAAGSGYSVLDAIADITQDMEAIRANLRYALDAEPRDPNSETGKYALDDRTANWIQPDGASVTLVFPEPVDGRLRDFEVYVESLDSGTGNLSLTCEGYDSSDVLVLGNGGGSVPDIPLGGDTVLYFSEVKEGSFILKGEEFKAIAQGGN